MSEEEEEEEKKRPGDSGEVVYEIANTTDTDPLDR